jgi:hypothetical protein
MPTRLPNSRPSARSTPGRRKLSGTYTEAAATTATTTAPVISPLHCSFSSCAGGFPSSTSARIPASSTSM